MDCIGTQGNGSRTQPFHIASIPIRVILSGGAFQPVRRACPELTGEGISRGEYLPTGNKPKSFSTRLRQAIRSDRRGVILSGADATQERPRSRRIPIPLGTVEMDAPPVPTFARRGNTFSQLSAALRRDQTPSCKYRIRGSASQTGPRQVFSLHPTTTNT